jgi:hypothetical protein
MNKVGKQKVLINMEKNEKNVRKRKKKVFYIVRGNNSE